MPKPVSYPFPIRAQLPPNSAFGPRPLYNDFHSGVDFNSTTGVVLGTPICAAGDGVVVESYNGNSPGMSNWAKLRGTMVAIDHDDGWRTRYHMLLPNSNVPVGTRVKAGDIIGKVGNSGSSGTGAHLHFELWHNGVAINPVGQLVYDAYALAGLSASSFDNLPFGDSDMIVIHNLNSKQYAAVAPGYIHSLAEKDAQLIANVTSAQDEIHKLPDDQYRLVLAAHRIPLVYASDKILNAWGPKEGWWSETEDAAMQRRAQHAELMALFQSGK